MANDIRNGDADDRAIQNLKSRYLELVDLICDAAKPAKIDGLFDVFTDDVVLDFGEIMGTYRGREGIELLFGTLLPAQHRWTIHMSGSPQIMVDGDRAEGRWTLYALSSPRQDLEGTTLATFGHYRDEFVRTEKGWRQSRLGFVMRGQTGGAWQMPQ